MEFCQECDTPDECEKREGCLHPSGRAKINLSQQNRAVTLPDRALFAHPSSVTPDVKSGKTRASPFNGALASASFGKGVDPTCYNVCIGRIPRPKLFDIARIL